MKYVLKLVTVLTSFAMLMMLAPAVASAQPSPATSAAAAPAAAALLALDPKALENVPAAVQRLVPGSPSFLVRYFGTNRGGMDPDGLGFQDTEFAGAECSTRGGDIGLYTIDFVRGFGNVLQYMADMTGEPADYPSTPWPGANWTESANMPFPYGYDDGSGNLVHIPNPKLLSACGADLAEFGQPDAESPWGFNFFNEPDQGSVNAFLSELSATPAKTADEVGMDTGVLSGDQSWVATNKAWEGTDFPVTDFMNYCTDALNPLCMTAMFLHCPESGPGMDQCRQFNVNTMKLNIALVTWVAANGGSEFHVWDSILRAGRTLFTNFKILAIIAGVAAVTVACIYFCVAVAAGVASAAPVIIGVGRALLASGGLKKLALAAAGLLLVTGATGASIFGAIDCAASFGKCFAQWSGDGMVGALRQIPAAIQNSTVPDLKTVAWQNLFNDIAGIAAALLMVFFLIAVAAALLRGKPGEILPSLGGLLGFGVALGMGGTFLSLMIVLRDGVTAMLSGDSKSVGDISTSVADQQFNALTALIDGQATAGLLGVGVLAFFGMVMALIINVIIWLSNQWIPLAIAIMLLQTAGMAGMAGPRKWVIRGLSALWTLLLAKPMMMLTYRVGDAMIASASGFTALLGGVVVLASTVVVFIALPKLFALGDGTPLGVGAALKSGFDQMLAYRARGGKGGGLGGDAGGASTSQGQSRDSMNRGTVASTSNPTSASGGGASPVRAATGAAADSKGRAEMGAGSPDGSKSGPVGSADSSSAPSAVSPVLAAVSDQAGPALPGSGDAAGTPSASGAARNPQPALVGANGPGKPAQSGAGRGPTPGPAAPASGAGADAGAAAFFADGPHPRRAGAGSTSSSQRAPAAGPVAPGSGTSSSGAPTQVGRNALTPGAAASSGGSGGASQSPQPFVGNSGWSQGGATGQAAGGGGSHSSGGEAPGGGWRGQGYSGGTPAGVGGTQGSSAQRPADPRDAHGSVAGPWAQGAPTPERADGPSTFLRPLGSATGNGTWGNTNTRGNRS